MVLLISLQIIVAHEFFLFKKFYLVMKGRKREIEREREREREIGFSIDLCIHWLILICALTGD